MDLLEHVQELESVGRGHGSDLVRVALDDDLPSEARVLTSCFELPTLGLGEGAGAHHADAFSAAFLALARSCEACLDVLSQVEQTRKPRLSFLSYSWPLGQVVLRAFLAQAP